MANEIRRMRAEAALLEREMLPISTEMAGLVACIRDCLPAWQVDPLALRVDEASRHMARLVVLRQELAAKQAQRLAISQALEG